ncbi:hypothetical protein TNCT_642021 [Trichonephila clavata]|uniref:Uncharacterized protein n=1 Tax=Trichonephila clavata TaxID=2740835 RepID=A0A8X6JIF8_TRICU|nr:hypothetical protein TNCT_642021 [Trichonephila clavata]
MRFNDRKPVTGNGAAEPARNGKGKRLLGSGKTSAKRNDMDLHFFQRKDTGKLKFVTGELRNRLVKLNFSYLEGPGSRSTSQKEKNIWATSISDDALKVSEMKK